MYTLPEGFWLPAGIAGGAFALFLAWLGFKAQHLPVQTGNEGMIGLTGVISRRPGFRNRWVVEVRGELWWCRSSSRLQDGMTVKIRGLSEFVLDVIPVGDDSCASADGVSQNNRNQGGQ